MAVTQSGQRGGTSEQHAKAGSQSHKNDDQKSGGQTSNQGWKGDPEGHAEAGRKGGEAVSQDRKHMAEIGKKGGEARAENDDSSKGSRSGGTQASQTGGQRSSTSKQPAKSGK